MSGGVISTLVASALGGLSHIVLQKLPGMLSQIPVLRIGIPAVLSLYFDIFSGIIQAYIFALLTMMYVVNGFPEEKYEARVAKKRARLAEKKKATA
jgi:F-type H+-transporting ATPase subunit a